MRDTQPVQATPHPELRSSQSRALSNRELSVPEREDWERKVRPGDLISPFGEPVPFPEFRRQTPEFLVTCCLPYLITHILIPSPHPQQIKPALRSFWKPKALLLPFSLLENFRLFPWALQAAGPKSSAQPALGASRLQNHPQAHSSNFPLRSILAMLQAPQQDVPITAPQSPAQSRSSWRGPRPTSCLPAPGHTWHILTAPSLHVALE